MQILSLEKRFKPGNAQITKVAVNHAESLHTPYAVIDDLSEARLALGEAARVIGAQELRIRQLEDMALSDELTGLANRRGLLKAMNREIAAAQRDDAADGALIMIDLDGFKCINDRWGHAAGDDYLRAVGQALTSLVRASDVVARLGGDEFAVLLTRIGEDAAIARVDNLEKTFNIQMVDIDHNKVPMRGSFGHAPYRGTHTPEAVMVEADLKLYAHKARKSHRRVLVTPT